MKSQVFFAICASVLVKRYAIYARHSGIPEIKTVLGGFVIRRFMGAWTLVIKSIGLVRTCRASSREGSANACIKVSCRSFRALAWKRRPPCPRCMLLRKSLDEDVRSIDKE